MSCLNIKLKNYFLVIYFDCTAVESYFLVIGSNIKKYIYYFLGKVGIFLFFSDKKYYIILRLITSCSVRCLQIPRAKFFLVNPAKTTRSNFMTS